MDEVTAGGGLRSPCPVLPDTCVAFLGGVSGSSVAVAVTISVFNGDLRVQLATLSPGGGHLSSPRRSGDPLPGCWTRCGLVFQGVRLGPCASRPVRALVGRLLAQGLIALLVYAGLGADLFESAGPHRLRPAEDTGYLFQRPSSASAPRTGWKRSCAHISRG